MAIEAKHQARDRFLDTWGLVHTNIRSFDYWVNKHDFTISEKKLLHAFYLYKKNKKNECLELLQFKIDANTFLEGIRYYLIGLVYNQFGHFFYSIENLEKSVSKFEESGELEFIVNPLSLLVGVYGNRREINKMAECLDRLKEYSPQNNIRKLQIMLAEMTYYTISGQSQKVESIHRKAEEQNLKGFENFRPFFLVNLFMAYVQEKKYEICYKILKEYSSLSGCLVKANYLYMKTLLDHLVYDKPIYVYAKEFKDFPEMHFQLEVIKALKIGDRREAQKYWKMLSKHNPTLYEENFKLNSESSLFYQTLERYLGNAEVKVVSKVKVDLLSSNLKKLHYILSSSNAPVGNEELIRLIWGEEFTEKSFARLRKLVSDYTKQYKVEIRGSQSTYQILKKIS